jgi:hypothetical protein
MQRPQGPQRQKRLVQRDEGERKNEKEETRIDESGYRRWEPGIRTEVNVERGKG